jgi:hypothetical protein
VPEDRCGTAIARVGDGVPTRLRHVVIREFVAKAA